MWKEKIKLEEVSKLAEVTPLILNIHPISLLYLPQDILVFEDEEKLLEILDSPSVKSNKKIIISDKKIQKYTKLYHRLPYFKVEHNPFTSQLNNIITSRFNELREILRVQSKIKDKIISDAVKRDPNFIILYIIDGLSYSDFQRYCDCSALRDWNYEIEPILVDCPTTTVYGMSNILGESGSALAVRLHKLGYRIRFGFTFWKKENNKLTKKLFVGFNKDNINIFPEFVQIREKMEEIIGKYHEEKVYIQIIRAGFDEYAHHLKIDIKKEAIFQTIFEEISEIKNFVDAWGISANIYITADHGILWKEDLKDAVILNVGHHLENPRYLKEYSYNINERDYVKFLTDNGKIYCLGYPYLKRPLKPSERGVHGGISYQESLIPLFSIYT